MTIEELRKQFLKDAKAKFLKGQKEHGDWDDIDPYKEIYSELVDIQNYAGHPLMDDRNKEIIQYVAFELVKLIKL